MTMMGNTDDDEEEHQCHLSLFIHTRVVATMLVLKSMEVAYILLTLLYSTKHYLE